MIRIQTVLRGIVLELIFVLGYVSESFAFGLTVDQMYRNLIGSEQEVGRVQMGQPLLAFKKADSKPEAIWREKKAYFEKQTQKSAEFEHDGAWSDIVVSVKQGRVSPFDLAEIRRQSERENAEAVELLAWMYATGTGLRQDLQKSYAYYLQAAHMGVPSAYDNVRAVYRAMSPAQRAALPSF